MAGVKTIWLVKRFVNGQASEVEQDQLAIWLDTHTDEEVGDVLALAYEDYPPPTHPPTPRWQQTPCQHPVVGNTAWYYRMGARCG